jgi:hypothetical protein
MPPVLAERRVILPAPLMRSRTTGSPMYSIDPAPEISASRLLATRTTARPAPLTAILAVCDSSPGAR